MEIIAARTRSKLCLTTTAIETIESEFVPPDITTDMYDFDTNVDNDWLNFLHGFTKPIGKQYYLLQLISVFHEFFLQILKKKKMMKLILNMLLVIKHHVSLQILTKLVSMFVSY